MESSLYNAVVPMENDGHGTDDGDTSEDSTNTMAGGMSRMYHVIKAPLDTFSFGSGLKGGGELDAIKTPLVDFRLLF
jgi:hypothetical protein